MRKQLKLAICLVNLLWSSFFVSSKAQAVDLTSEYSSGTYSSAFALTADGDFPSHKKISDWSWSGNYTYSTASTPASAGNAAVNDYTNAFDGALDYENDEGHLGSVELTSSSTPNENLVNRGGKIAGGLRYHYNDSSLSESEGKSGFRPYLMPKVELGYLNYIVNYDATKAMRLLRGSNAGTTSMRQLEIRGSLAWKMIEVFRLKMTATQYLYDRNVADFLNYLNSPQAARRGLSGLSGSVSGIPSWDASVLGSLEFFDIYSWDISGTYSELAADGTPTGTLRSTLNASVFAEALRIWLGYEYQTSNTQVDNLGIVGLDWHI